MAQMDGFHAGIRLQPHLALEQRLVLRQRPWTPKDFLTGTPQDFERLLKADPPVDSHGIVRYIVAGGWASEILTGSIRPHHDLDVVLLDSSIPLTYMVDQQEAGNYFGTFSLRPDEMLDQYVDVVTWNPHKTRPVMKDKDYRIPVPNAEFLLLSKACGFLRAPREKDMDDIEALALKVGNCDASRGRYEDLLKHIPGLHPDFPDNKELFADLGGEGACAYQRASDYLVKIVNAFKSGERELARDQVTDFHKTLNEIYREGLKHTATVVDVRDKLVKDAWKANRLEGFWVMGERGPELRIFPSEGNAFVKKSLEAIARAERDLNRTACINWSNDLSVVRFAGGKGRPGTVLIDAEKGIHSKVYRPIKIVRENNYSLIAEKGRTIVLDSNYSEFMSIKGTDRSISGLYAALIKSHRFTDVKKLVSLTGFSLAAYNLDYSSGAAIREELQRLLEQSQHKPRSKAYSKLQQMASMLETEPAIKASIYKDRLLAGDFTNAKKIADVLGVAETAKYGQEAIGILTRDLINHNYLARLEFFEKIISETGAVPAMDAARIHKLGLEILTIRYAFDFRLASLDKLLGIFDPAKGMEDAIIKDSYEILLQSSLEDSLALRDRVNPDFRIAAESRHLGKLGFDILTRPDKSIEARIASLDRLLEGFSPAKELEDDLISSSYDFLLQSDFESSLAMRNRVNPASCLTIESKHLDAKVHYLLDYITRLDETTLLFIEKLGRLEGAPKPAPEKGLKLYMDLLLGEARATGTGKLNKRVFWADKVANVFGFSDSYREEVDMAVYKLGLLNGREPIVSHLRQVRKYDSSLDTAFFLAEPEKFSSNSTIRLLNLEDSPSVRKLAYGMLENGLQGSKNFVPYVKMLIDKFNFGEGEVWTLASQELLRRVHEEKFDLAVERAQTLAIYQLVARERINDFYAGVINDFKDKGKYKEAAYFASRGLKDDDAAKELARQALISQKLNRAERSSLKYTYGI